MLGGANLVNNRFPTVDQFVLGTQAQDSEDRFIYNRNNGDLFFDSNDNGAGGQIQIARLSNKPNLTNSEILVVSNV